MKTGKILGLFLVLGMLTSAHAFAQDLDVDGARRQYEQQKRIADRAEAEANTAKRDYDRKKYELDRALQRLQNARQSVRNLERQKRDLEAEISTIDRRIGALRSEIPRLESDVSRKQGEVTALERRKQQGEQRRNRLQAAITDLNQQIRELEGQDPPPTDRINKLKEQRREKQQQLAQVNQNINQVNNQIAALNRDISNLNRTIQTKKRQLQADERALPQKRNSLNRVIRDLDSARDDFDDAERDHTYAERESQRAWDDYQVAYRTWQREDREARDRYQYLQQVIANYNAERDRIFANARTSGSADGRQEASTRHVDAGTSVGSSDGSRDGTAEGTADGKLREYAEGYTRGRQTASTDGSLRTSYNAGKQAGSQIADNKAMKEDYPKGYNDAYASKISGTPDSDVTIDITESLPSDPGGNGEDLTGSNKRPGSVDNPAFGFPRTPETDPPTAGNPRFSIPASNGRFSDAPCNNLRLPEFAADCRRMYNEEYLSSYNSRYSSIYVANYRAAYNTASASAYDAARSTTYPAELQRGLQVGAKEQGILDGFAARYPLAKTEKYAKGERDFAGALDQGYLLVVRSVSFVDANGDGVTAPGEGARLVLTVDNFGGIAAAKEGFRFLVEGKNKVSEVNFEIRDLPALPGNSRIKLVGVLSAKVATEFAKEEYGITGRIERKTAGGYETIAALDAKGETHFPMELDAVEIPKVGINQTTIGKFTFKNLSNKTVAASELSLDALENAVEIVSEDLELPELAPGEETTLEVEVKPTYWVGSSAPVKFNATVNDGQDLDTKQAFLQEVLVQRDAGVKLLNSRGQQVLVPEFDVAAGSTFSFLVNMDFQATQRRRGPFVLEFWQKSHSAMRHGNNSTTRISYGSWSPNTRSNPSRMAWYFPQEMRGQQAWATVRMLDNRNISHAIKIRFNVK